ncbi:MAG: M20/M25/M40 family metallo-hydrolase [Daejeonella sp.]|uniref:M20/M25/M40 family metallo-hydrolase n=1 Tax=Daejeonella sp. TaxID=2805397 RepID=UPI0027344150|nr:M20/M25/M40 family metallo-hydrolase [Daejeonella sp.]MDP3469251.1 M20/M25/M40 family metallo-hydrolase [Daejeonella sp.]
MKYLLLSLFTFSAFLGYSQTLLIRQDQQIKKMVDEVSAQNIELIVRKLVTFETRHSLSDTVSCTSGIGAARNWIKSELERYSKASGGRLKVEFDTFTQPADGRRIVKPTVMKNVLGILPGTDPADDRVFIVSGHYDSRASDVNDSMIFAPGANDDASGTAAAMELARVMSRYKFNCTLIFVAMVAEEQGLYGAANLAKRAKAEKWNLAGMITNDIVGNTYGMETGIKDNSNVRIFSEGVSVAESPEEAARRASTGSENDGHARQFARYMKEVGERYVDQLNVKLIYRRDRYLRGGDHTPFSQQGFAGIRITEMNEDFDRQHQNVRKENGVDYGDLPDFVDYTYTQKVTRMNLATLANLALAPREPLNVGIVTSGLTNKTVLKWENPVGEKPAGYYVVMRETTSPVWERKFFFTGNTASLNYSKDNYYFGVQSVDADGHESQVVIPKSVR